MTSRAEAITTIYKVYLADEVHYHGCLGGRGKAPWRRRQFSFCIRDIQYETSSYRNLRYHW
jgi:hypothetical protein